MRKRLFTLLLLLCPMLIAGMANAGQQLYLIGDAPFGNGWVTSNVKAMTLESDGVTNTFTGTSSGNEYFAICTGPADDWNTMNGQLRYGWTGEIQDGETYTLTKGEKTMHITEPGEWKITVNSETMEMKVEKLAAAADTWSIIGGIFDTNWNTDWDMTLGADGKYTLTVTDKTMMAGTYEYKARKNHVWATTIPSGTDNASLTISEDGIYNVVFTLDVDEATVNAVATKTGSAVIEKIYTVVGTPAAIFGEAWNPALTQNEMSSSDGVNYTWTKENVELETGNIEFKVIVGHSWGGIEYGNNGQNIVYNVTEDGTYNVTITFNAETEATPVLNLEKVGGADIQHTYQIAGVGELGLTWTPSDNPMTEENGTWTLTKNDVTLLPGEYAYKLVQDGNTWIPDGTGNDHKLVIKTLDVYNVVFTMTEPTNEGYNADATRTNTEFAFSVAGSNGAIFGTAWWENADGDAANAMTLTDGKYVITKTGVELTAGEFQYRVRINGAYTTDQGFAYNANGIFNIEGIGSNKAVTVAQDGKYDITITFDPTAKTVTETLVREAAQVKDYTVTFVNSGNWEGDVSVWAWNSNKDFFEEWPGAAATKTAEKAGEWDIWTYTFEQLSEDDLPTNVIFSAGGVKTQDLVFADNGEYWGVDKYGLEGTAFGGFKDDAQYRGIERILTDEGNGVYTYREENVALEAVAYPYRVSKNGKWVTNTGIGGVDGNKEFIPEAAGNYNITVTMYNTAEKKDVEVTLTPVGVVTEAKYYIVGEEDLLGVAWAADEANELTFNGDAWTLTKSNLTLTARDYEYKLLKVEGETQTWIPGTPDNKILTIEEDGEYNVYFIMDEPTDNGYRALAEKIDEPQPTGVTFTIVNNNTEEWPALALYNWGDISGETLGPWPGVVLYDGENVVGNDKVTVTKDGNTYTVTLAADLAYENLILNNNNNGKQMNLTNFADGATYTIEASAPVVTTTVYYVDMQGWAPRAYVWGNGVDYTAVESTTSKQINVFGVDFLQYQFEVNAAAANILFATDGYTHQTSDLPLIAGATYANDGDEPNGIVLFTDDAEQFQPAEDVNVNVKASYARKFDTSKVYTVVLPFAMPADQTAGKFYTLTSVTDGVIHGESVVAPAPYMPYIFEPATEYPFTNINVGQLPKAQVNTINAAGNAKMTFALEQTTLRSDAETTYYGWGTSEGFTKVAVGLAAPFRAWIEMPTVQANANSLVWMNDVVTGIDKVNVEISNGAKVYDLQGRQVTNPHRGIYIVNGKKYVVK